MASLAELNDTSSYLYDTGRGFSQADTGHGAPVARSSSQAVRGWMRSGGPADSITNCGAWSSVAPADEGRTHGLVSNTDEGGTIRWYMDEATCDLPQRVWCVED